MASKPSEILEEFDNCFKKIQKGIEDLANSVIHEDKDIIRILANYATAVHMCTDATMRHYQMVYKPMKELYDRCKNNVPTLHRIIEVITEVYMLVAMNENEKAMNLMNETFGIAPDEMDHTIIQASIAATSQKYIEMHSMLEKIQEALLMMQS